MVETTRIITIELTDVIKGEMNRDAESERKGLETLFGIHDDVHVKVQDFVLETE